MTNPFFTPWTTPFEAIPFNLIKEEHYKEALLEGMKQHNAEIEAIANNPAPATFENTILPLETAGGLLDQVSAIFYNLTMTDATDYMRDLDLEMTGPLTEHSVAIGQNPKIFARIKAVYADKDKLTSEQARLVKIYHDGYVRTGADLNDADKKTFSDISSRLATLNSLFEQKTIAETSAYEMVLESADDLRGLPAEYIDSARRAATAKGHDGKVLITLLDPSVRPFMKFSENRALREKLFKAQRIRNDQGGEHDTNELIVETLKLRLQKANLLGYKTTADYMFHERMLRQPKQARDLLLEVLDPALKTAVAEHDKLLALHREAGFNDEIQPWDVPFYVERYKQRHFNLNENELKQYFTLDSVLDAAFYCAGQLFGLKFEVLDAPLYNPDVRLWNVSNKAGEHIGLFYGDFFARETKGGGAWCSNLRSANPLIGSKSFGINCSNFSKPAPGEQALVTPMEVEHVFHEFGHLLHDMLSHASYPSLHGRRVSRDFVELPSQLFEHWAFTDQVIEKFFHHYKTGEALPTAQRKLIRDSLLFGEGVLQSTYIAVAVAELDAHLETDYTGFDVSDYQEQSFKALGMPGYLLPRYRFQHFGHVFASGYYAGYYSYLWSAVLDNDAFKAFDETGDIFDPATAQRLLQHIYGAGNSEAPDVLYEKFRGRGPTIDALLEYKGLKQGTAA